MEALKQKLQLLLSSIRVILNNEQTPKGTEIYQIAKGTLGADASPADIAPDEYGCAESVSDILQKASISIPTLVSTASLYAWLQANALQVGKPIRGDVIISPTGQGTGGLANGHTGIMADSYRIMSNSSATGTWQLNYNIDTWKARYQTLGGFPILFFRFV